MIETISEDDLLLMECLNNPISAIECLFSSLEDLSWNKPNEFANIRMGQIPMLSYEYMIDDEAGLSKQENFKLRENVGNIECFAARKFGKTLIVEVCDIFLTGIHNDGWDCGFCSYDAIHIRGILDDKVIPVLSNHPFLKEMMPNEASKGIIRSPNYKIRFKNGCNIVGINFNLQSSNPGNQFFQKHLKKLWIEEASMETQKVYDKRIESTSEIGCIIRAAGMTNFTKYSPVGKRFYDISNKMIIVNLPQYINPFFNIKTKRDAIKKYGGEGSVGYRIFIKGEVIEDGIAVFDMERVRRCYEDKPIKHFEVTKNNFEDFKYNLIIEKPPSVEECYVTADIGETAPTEIMIFFKISDKYRYTYRITFFNLDDKQQTKIFDFIINAISPSVVGIDCSEGTGRAIYRSLAQKYPKDNLSWVAFNEKIKVDFEKTDDGKIKFNEKGQVQYQEEFVSEWSVKYLKDILYNQKVKLTLDFNLDEQLNSVIATQSGQRTIYAVAGEEDHLFAAFRVFAISLWQKEFALNRPIKTKSWGKTGA